MIPQKNKFNIEYLEGRGKSGRRGRRREEDSGDERVKMEKNMDSTLVLVLVLVLDEDVVLVLEEGVDIAPALALVLDEDVVRTQGHPDRRHHSRWTQ